MMQLDGHISRVVHNCVRHVRELHRFPRKMMTSYAKKYLSMHKYLAEIQTKFPLNFRQNASLEEVAVLLFTCTSLVNILLVCNTMALKFLTLSNSKIISTGLPISPGVSFRQPIHS